MPTKISDSELHAFARAGAEQELNRIYAAFPDLRQPAKAPSTEPKRHWTQTTEGRQRMSRYMKRAWRRKQEQER